MRMKRLLLSERLATWLILVIMVLALSLAGLVWRIDNVLYDAAQKFIDRDIPQDVVLVAIDEQSLFELGRWPWSRRLHAQLIDRLRSDGAKVIGFDVMFSEPQHEDPQADRLLARALSKAGNVVLPVVIEKVRRNGQLVETLPLPELVANASALGRVHAELDADSIARSISLWEGLGQPIWPSFAQAMLTTAGQLPAHHRDTAPQAEIKAPFVLSKQDQRYINFSTSQRQLATLSYVQVLRGEFTPGTFKGKLVLVGATASGMADSLPTPVSGFQQPMSGVEFLANTMISMREQSLVKLSPLWLSTLLACGLAGMPMLWLPYTRARTGLLTNIGFALLVLGCIMMMPIFFYVWFPLFSGVLGILSAYPIWAWRKLESASRFLDAELIRLNQELSVDTQWQTGLDSREKDDTADPFQRRIDQIRAASAKLQNIEQAQKETIAFISHDIRVPIASAAEQIKNELGHQHPAYKQLSRALMWTEDFLHTSRAQMLQSHEFVDLDLVGLLHEVVDQIYPLTQEKALHLIVDVPDDVIWVKGHFDTLSRAIANLLTNAVKFSPPNGKIQLRLQTYANQAHIAVSDQGAGIALHDAEKLFKRFSRLESHAPSAPSGLGLGLYFVQITLHKHGGTVRMSSRPGNTTFILIFPKQEDAIFIASS